MKIRLKIFIVILAFIFTSNVYAVDKILTKKEQALLKQYKSEGYILTNIDAKLHALKPLKTICFVRVIPQVGYTVPQVMVLYKTEAKKPYSIAIKIYLNGNLVINNPDMGVSDNNVQVENNIHNGLFINYTMRTPGGVTETKACYTNMSQKSKIQIGAFVATPEMRA